MNSNQLITSGKPRLPLIDAEAPLAAKFDRRAALLRGKAAGQIGVLLP
ncbi:hypothetical protein [Prauserella alba]|nr:hypothetical protein [Prauserella alba]